MDQERLSSLAMCTIQCETANKFLYNDTELLINKFAAKHGRKTRFCDQLLMYILIFGLTYCICSMRISLYCMYPV